MQLYDRWLIKQATLPALPELSAAPALAQGTSGFWGTLKSVAKGLAAPAVLGLGGAVLDKATGAISNRINEELAFRAMNKYLKSMPEQRKRMMGMEGYDDDLVKSRFKSLYRLSPGLMDDPQTALGQVSNSLMANEYTLSPDAARGYVDLHAAMQRAATPGVFSETAKAMTPALSQVMLKRYMEPTQAELSDLQHRQALRTEEYKANRAFQAAQGLEAIKKQDQKELALYRANMDIGADLDTAYDAQGGAREVARARKDEQLRQLSMQAAKEQNEATKARLDAAENMIKLREAQNKREDATAAYVHETKQTIDQHQALLNLLHTPGAQLPPNAFSKDPRVVEEEIRRLEGSIQTAQRRLGEHASDYSRIPVAYSILHP